MIRTDHCFRFEAKSKRCRGTGVTPELSLATVICKQMCVPGPRGFDQSGLNKSSWLHANVTLCMWMEEAMQGPGLIRGKLINGRLNRPPVSRPQLIGPSALNPHWYQLFPPYSSASLMNRSIIQWILSIILVCFMYWSGSSLNELSTASFPPYSFFFFLTFLFWSSFPNSS